MLNATTVIEQPFGFAVVLGAGDAAGGYAVTGPKLAMFQPSSHADGADNSGGSVHQLKKG